MSASWTRHLPPPALPFPQLQSPLVSEGRRNGRYVAKATTNSTSDWFHPLAYLQSNLLHDLRQVTEPPPPSLCLSIISYKEENNNPARGSSATQKMRWRLYKVPQRAESAPNIEDVRQEQPGASLELWTSAIAHPIVCRALRPAANEICRVLVLVCCVSGLSGAGGLGREPGVLNIICTLRVSMHHLTSHLKS